MIRDQELDDILRCLDSNPGIQADTKQRLIGLIARSIDDARANDPLKC